MRIWKEKTSADKSKKKAIEDFKERMSKSKFDVALSISYLSGHEAKPLFYSCDLCGHPTDIFPGNHDPKKVNPRRLCLECERIKDNGYVEEILNILIENKGKPNDKK